MEKQLVQQLINSGISVKKLKDILDSINNDNRNVTETIVANTCGLRIIKCLGCHRELFEDKFMLNKINK
eukprot:5202749-Amphidinium_carterae.1